MRHAQRPRDPRSTAEAMWRVHLRALHSCRDALALLGVTPTQAGVLLYVQRYPGSYQQCVADAFGIDATWTGVVIGMLQRKGWVKKQRAPCDDSYVLLTVTHKGTALARKIIRGLATAPRRNNYTTEHRSAAVE